MSLNNPDATLCSVVWNWSAYYTSMVSSIIDGSYDGSNYYGGMKEGLVDITGLSDKLNDEDTIAAIQDAKDKILSGAFNVFDGIIKTNTGDTVGKEGSTLDDATITGGINWYFQNVSVLQEDGSITDGTEPLSADTDEAEEQGDTEQSDTEQN